MTPQVHHWTFEVGALGASQQLGGKHLNLVMRAHSPENLTACWTFPRSACPTPSNHAPAGWTSTTTAAI